LDDERAEHVPGCNIALRRERLVEIGGFDPIYRAAGDDVAVCWKLLDPGYNIPAHPSALVWHRCRDCVRASWRQQLGFGLAEALVGHYNPDKFINSLGQVTRGMIYGTTSVLPGGFASTPGGSATRPSGDLTADAGPAWDKLRTRWRKTSLRVLGPPLGCCGELCRSQNHIIQIYQLHAYGYDASISRALTGGSPKVDIRSAQKNIVEVL